MIFFILLIDWRGSGKNSINSLLATTPCCLFQFSSYSFIQNCAYLWDYKSVYQTRSSFRCFAYIILCVVIVLCAQEDLTMLSSSVQSLMREELCNLCFLLLRHPPNHIHLYHSQTYNSDSRTYEFQMGWLKS